jgi:hypothetical protein
MSIVFIKLIDFQSDEFVGKHPDVLRPTGTAGNRTAYLVDILDLMGSSSMILKPILVVSNKIP